MSTFVYSYKMGSKSGKDIANGLGVKRIRHKNSQFVGDASKTVINWGSSNLPDEVLKCNIINKPHAISLAANKLKAFNAMKAGGVRIPNYTTDPMVAANMINEGHEVMARHKLSGHSGIGIELLANTNKIPDAPLYVQYVPKDQEYRVHIFQGKVVDVQRKARKKDVPDEQVNWKIRNHGNGFIFARNEDHVPNEEVLTQSIKAVEALSLDFGAVDVIWSDKLKLAFVLEVNTAPGVTGTTLKKYVERFTNYLKGEK